VLPYPKTNYGVTNTLHKRKLIFVVLLLVPTILSGIFVSRAEQRIGNPVAINPISIPNEVVDLARAPAWSFRDDFNYNNLTQLAAAGWVINTQAPSYYIIGGGLATLLNDGTQGALLRWQNIPKRVSDWNVSFSEEWVGNPIGTLQVTVHTAGHIYFLLADGYYSAFELMRDACCNKVIQLFGYQPQLNVFHNLRVEMKNKLLSFFFDGSLLFTYTETDNTHGATNLAFVDFAGGYLSNDAYDWVQLSSITKTR